MINYFSMCSLTRALLHWWNSHDVTKKADDKIYICKLSKNAKSRLYQLRFQRLEANSADPDEVAHDEPPHQDLRCLHIQLFTSLVLKEFILPELCHTIILMLLTPLLHY